LVAPRFRRVIAGATVAVVAIVSAASADPAGPNAGTAAPTAVDWFARTIALVTGALSILTFIWTRIDKWRERSAVKAAKTPIVDGYLQPTGRDEWVLNSTIRNRGDFILVLDQISVSDGFTFGSAGDSSSKIRSFKNERASPHNQIRIGAHVHRRGQEKSSISITFNMTSLSPEPKRIEMVVTRDL
jgi:hypothetical protein